MKALIFVLFCSMAALGQKPATNGLSHCDSLLEKENPFETEHLSSADRSDLEFCRVSDTMQAVETRMSPPDRNYDFWKTFRNQTVALWLDLRDAFCEFHPAAKYVDFFDNIEHCPAQGPAVHTSKDELEKLFSGSETVHSNMEMFIEEQNCNGEKECLQKLVDTFKPLVKALKDDNKK